MIEDVKVDCDCNVVNWERIPIKINNSTRLTVSYNNHIKGYFKRVIVVNANASTSPLFFTFSGKTI